MVTCFAPVPEPISADPTQGRIPVLVDNTRSSPFAVMETSAELLYLLEVSDPDNVFGFSDAVEQSECLQWLFFWHGSGAPYQGQVIHFALLAKEKLPYAIERFKGELLRVFGVLEIQLSGKLTGTPREYLAGRGTGKYSVADIGTWPWINLWEFTGITREQMGQFPHLSQWCERIGQRPAVTRGLGDKYQQK